MNVCMQLFFCPSFVLLCPRRSLREVEMPEVYIHIDGRLKTNFHRNENLLSKFKIGNGHPIGIYLS